MKNQLTYKMFTGSVQFSIVDKCFFGKVEGIDDLITYKGSTVKELEKAFHEMEDGHLVDSGE
jgi:predicted HicB family RNase H-like nuclease